MLNEETYFKWLCSFVNTRVYSFNRYSKLLRILFDTDFIYIHRYDENRAIDGEGLRYYFSEDTGIDLGYPHDKRCSVLEMMIALSMKIQSDYMDNPIDGDETYKWFWDMIHNLGLLNMDNKHFDYERSMYIIMRFLTLKYDSNGRGGLFIIDGIEEDVYDIDIWTQADYWIDQNY